MKKLLATLVFTLLATPALAKQDLILATTTSTQDTGLLDVLLPMFSKETGISVKPIAVGSGQALELGRRGEADVLLVHAPKAEATFMDKGFGSERLAVMHNSFMVVGPAEDPAHIKGKSATEAFKILADSQALFVSRGDESGTHQLEKTLWASIPTGKNYQSTGSGMGDTLSVASEKGAYTLTDRGTYLAIKKRLMLSPIVTQDPKLKNAYHVIVVNPKLHKTQEAEARTFAKFITSAKIQRVIGNFGIDRFGEPLFVPDALK